MARKIVRTTFCLVITGIVLTAVLSTQVTAQVSPIEPATASEPFINFRQLTVLIIESLIFSIVGLVVLMVGYKIFDVLTPYDLNKEIAEDSNTAAGIAVAGVLIALGLIVSAAIGL